MKDKSIHYSIVIPLKNEEANIRELVEELEPVMEMLYETWELIFVDDGSTDNTRSILLDLAHQKPYLRLVLFDGNYGQSSAFDAGFQLARGHWVITLDGDLQNDPADIPRLVAASKEYDLICGIRKKRQDSWSKRALSKMANKVRAWICDDGMQDTGCSLKIYRRECLLKIKMFHGMHRFLPALFKIEGFKIKEIPVNHRKRLKGTSKYHLFNRSLNTVADLFAVYWMKKRVLRYQIESILGPHDGC